MWGELDADETRKAIKTLRALNYKEDDIQNQPSIFHHSEITLRNRHNILSEAGFDKLSIGALSRYITICHKSITLLKAHHLIPENTDVTKRIFDSFQLESTSSLNESQIFEKVRCEALSAYLQKVLEFTDTDIKQFWHSYRRAKHKSAASILEMVALLKKELNFNAERIRKNAFVIYADPQSFKMYFTDFKTVGGCDIRELLSRRPKLINSNPEIIKKTLDVLDQFNISAEALGVSPEVLTLGPDTIKQRLQNLKSIKEFDGLIDHPRILKLVYYQMKAKARLQYLQQLKFKNASLNILSSASETFERYTREGADKTNGKDTVQFLARHLGRSDDELREWLGRHPNWMCIPLMTVKENFDMLSKLKYQPNTIFHNIHLLIYPPERVREVLQQVKLDLECEVVRPSQILSMTLYHLEQEYHFTGDGVWTDPADIAMTRQADSSDLPHHLPLLAGFGGRKVKKEILP